MDVPMTARWLPSALMVTHSRPIPDPEKRTNEGNCSGSTMGNPDRKTGVSGLGES
jgi:hypothetical protein